MTKKPASPAYVVGVGMTKFIKPRGKVDYTELGFEVCALPNTLRIQQKLTIDPPSRPA